MPVNDVFLLPECVCMAWVERTIRCTPEFYKNDGHFKVMIFSYFTFRVYRSHFSGEMISAIRMNMRLDSQRFATIMVFMT